MAIIDTVTKKTVLPAAQIAVAVAETTGGVGLEAATMGVKAELGGVRLAADVAKVAAGVGLAVVEVATQTAPLMHATAIVLKDLGLTGVASEVNKGADVAAETTDSKWFTAGCLVASAVLTIVSAEAQTGSDLLGVLSAVGTYGAGKQLADADAERAALTSEIGKLGQKVYGMMNELRALQRGLDGQDRELSTKVIGSHDSILTNLSKAADSLADIRKVLIAL